MKYPIFRDELAFEFFSVLANVLGAALSPRRQVFPFWAWSH